MGDVLWIENAGSISFVDDKQCVWKAPACLVLNTNACVTSPFFSLEGRRWRIAKMHENLYLWNEERILPYDVRYVNLSVRSTSEEEDNDDWSCEGETYRDYGFGGPFPQGKYGIGTVENVYFGCIKIHCKVKKSGNNPSDALSSEEKSKRDIENAADDDDDKNDVSEVKGVDRLLQNLKSLLTEGQNSDAVLKVEKREFRVHRGILGARSPVFLSMFQHEMKENTSGVVDIPDCTADSFEVFLLYLYTGSAETMSSDDVFDLYYAADKYRVDDLKEECVQFMKANMSVENICDVYALSLTHNERKLQKDATQFFRDNVKKIIRTSKWQKYLEEHSTYANELLIKALGD